MPANRGHSEAVKGPEDPGVGSYTPVREPLTLAWLWLLWMKWSGKIRLPEAPHGLPATFRPLLADASSRSRAVQGVEVLTPYEAGRSRAVGNQRAIYN